MNESFTELLFFTLLVLTGLMLYSISYWYLLFTLSGMVYLAVILTYESNKKKVI